jgi:hypothetical protein
MTFDKNMFIQEPLHDYGQLIIYDNSLFGDRPYISGHFGINPIIENEYNLDVMSIVRDPIDHYLSVAAYVAATAQMKMSNDFLEEFLYGYVTPFGSNELFSSSGNIQSKMLFCRIAIADSSVVAVRDGDVANESNLVFIESDMPDEKKIADKIKLFNIFTLQNRHKAVSWLDNKIFNLYGFRIDSSINLVSNCSNNSGFTPDKSHIKEIESRSQIDRHLYQVVLEMDKMRA